MLVGLDGSDLLEKMRPGKSVRAALDPMPPKGIDQIRKADIHRVDLAAALRELNKPVQHLQVGKERPPT